MHFLTHFLPLLPLLPLAFSAPTLQPRQTANAIVSALTTIENRISTLNSTLNTLFPRDPAALLKVGQLELETAALGVAIQQGTSAANQSPVLSDADSQTVAVAVLGFEPQIFSLLNNFVAKKPAFDTAVLTVGSVSGIVELELKQQASLSADLGNAIAAKVSAEFQGPAGIINGQIAAAFAAAVKAFDTGIFG